MTYIYEHQDWPDFEWDNRTLALSLTELRGRLNMHTERVNSLEPSLRDEVLLKTLSTEVVKSSEIEGENICLSATRASIAIRLGIETEEVKTNDTRADHLANLILDATQNYDASISEKRLCDWHRDLFPKRFSGREPITLGAWRPLDSGTMQVVSGAYGKRKVHFEAPSPEKLDKEMKQLFTWINGPKSIDPILKAGIASFWFVTIHPFEDGNGRISRAIAETLLARADQSKNRYCCMSAQIFAERQEYYRQLEQQQKSGLNITAWLQWFVECLHRAVGRAEQQLEDALRCNQILRWARKKDMNERQDKVVLRMLGESWVGYMNSLKYSKMCKCSDSTAQRDIRDLLQKGILIQSTTTGSKTSFKLSNLEDI